MSFPSPDGLRSSWLTLSNHQYPTHHSPQPSSDPHHGYYGPASYNQPYIATSTPAPFIAELPAPLPPAPPTVTSNEQLNEDGLLAHQLQRLDVADARRKSSSALSFEHRRPVSIAHLSPQHSAPLVHQRSAHQLRPHAHSLSYTAPAWNSGPLVQSLPRAEISSLPEVVVDEPHHISFKQYRPPGSTSSPIAQNQSTSQPRFFSMDPASLVSYLEQHRQVPYPPQWSPPPTIMTLYAFQGAKIPSRSTWLDTPEACSWRTVRRDEYSHNPVTPVFTFRFKSSSGSFRSAKFTWTMNGPKALPDNAEREPHAPANIWTYELKLDSKTRLRKTEMLSHGSIKAILTTYIHASNYDSLRFIGPDGRAYMWVSSSKISSIGGLRYDTVRHALFVAVGNIPDPLYGQIVADHTFWDGHVDHDEVHVGSKCDGCQNEPIQGLRWRCRTCAGHEVCDTCRTATFNGQLGLSILPTCDFSLVNLPDEALCIRSSTVDPSLVVATLQVLKDWEKHTLREEKRTHNKEFFANEEAARQCDLGAMSYWKADDWGKNGAEGPMHGTTVKAHAITQSLGQNPAALGRFDDFAFSIAGLATPSDGGAGRGSGA